MTLLDHEIIVDNFAGGGGASTGIEMALGRPVDVAINHDESAVAMHAANHPSTQHYCQSVFRADPLEVTGGRPVGLAWFSPDCTHFSKAKGGKPVKANIRDLAWVVILWAKRVRPRVIFLENVEEFRQWGPLKLNDAGDLVPDPDKKGFTFRRWLRELKACGYKVEHREIRAQIYGVPTIRKRLYLIARCDGLPIQWPEATHGPGLRPYRTAADSVIDWSRPVYSIFLSREEGRRYGVNRPLAENTLARIARGVQRYVIDAARPFIVPLTHSGDQRVHSIDEPVRTLTTANGGELAFVSPVLVHTAHGERDSRGRKRGKGEKDSQAPMPTITASPDVALVAAFLAQHNAGPRNDGLAGRPADEPLSSVTTTGSQQQVVTAAFVVNQKGSDQRMASADQPLGTQCAQGSHFAAVFAFMQKYYGTGGQDQPVTDPVHTIPTKARFGVTTVLVEGEPHQIVDIGVRKLELRDIGMRMLTPRELFRAQGFPDSYKIDIEVDGRRLSKAKQIRMCGNSVCPPVAAALVRANFSAAVAQLGAAE